MSKMGQTGIATVAAAVAMVAIAGGAIGTPVAVDEIDVQPDSPLYRLERVGEMVKESTYAGGTAWELSRAEERTSEFQGMAEKGKAYGHSDLLDRSGDRLSRAAKSAGEGRDLQMVEDSLGKHIEVLENLRERVPDVAKPAISLAISRSARSKAAVSRTALGKSPSEKMSKAEREELRNRMKNVEDEAKELKERIRENLEEGMPPGLVVQNVELKTARDLVDEARKMTEEDAEEIIPPVLEEARGCVNAALKASGDNEGLERAIEVSKIHLEVLEQVYENVPEAAKRSIRAAIDNSRRCIQVLESLRGKAEEGELSPGDLEELEWNLPAPSQDKLGENERPGMQEEAPR